ncbi:MULTISPECIES: translation initiation factor IF-2 N-terminal domain-containing protein [Gordonia]|uniref:translation initiation factor IF-2 N-terminal domain-containing protein n=2 Tax=Gordoniaceae TaxID=85026 RepID=UPI000301ED42|nr:MULTISPECIES: translation initiation factor IF-2 N-terminal domain-containing protein [Gordonia]NKY93988.1 Rne/Rng family ribonuclease [Gordonia sputi]OBC08264.1 ribonuclease E [Gordonia sp. 852002-50395_SCH5434458]
MTDNGSPIDANAASGSAEDFPSKLRVHALARTLGLTSRQVLAHLAELGWPSRSAQSSVERSMAQAVADRVRNDVEVDDTAVPVDEAAPATEEQAKATQPTEPAEVSDQGEPAGVTEAVDAAPAPDAPASDAPEAEVPGAELPGVAASQPSAPAEVADVEQSAESHASHTHSLFSAIETEKPHVASPAEEIAASPLFLPPQPAAASDAPSGRHRKSGEDATADSSSDDSQRRANSGRPTSEPSTSGRSTPNAADESAEDSADPTDNEGADNEGADNDSSGDEGGRNRRRRRGRRGRGRGRGDQNERDQNDDTDSAASDDSDQSVSGQSDSDQSDSDQSNADQSNSDQSGSDRPAGKKRKKSGKGKPAEGKNAEGENQADGRGQGPGSSDDSNSSDDSADKSNGQDADNNADDSDDADSGDGTSSKRRRRRRRRKGGAESDDASSPDDPPNTVVHEREPRSKRARDEVQGISGSTRLEAKRQRRRDGRDAGRRRPPILSESEFLARREAVDRVMVVRERSANVRLSQSDEHDHVTPVEDYTQVAVLEDGVLVEHFVTTETSSSMVGNIYIGRVQNVLPGMEAAFVDIGRGRNGVLYAGEVNWDAAGLDGGSRKIEQALKPGDPVLVQVSKDPVGHKGARLTTQISLAGRYLVYVPGGTSTGISRKLPDVERKRLKQILAKLVPDDAGVIIRTASEGVSADDLAADIERLEKQWKSIDEAFGKANKGSVSPRALYEEPDLLVRVVRDLFNEDFKKLVVEGDKAWNLVEGYVSSVAPDLMDRVERFERPRADAPDSFVVHRIDEQLAKALDRKVWLPSGGTLIIEHTEAMTVVDVNTGKFTGSGGNLEETVTRNNLEAAEEIVRQMRLRDIGGMIIVDFIDMVLESNRDLVLRRLTEALSRDRTRHQVSEVTSLGLVQMTRKRLGTGLLEAFSTTCTTCGGRGIIVHSSPVEVTSDDGAKSENTGSKRSRRNKKKAEPAEQKPAHNPAEHPMFRAMAAHTHDEDGEVIDVEAVVVDDESSSNGSADAQSTGQDAQSAGQDAQSTGQDAQTTGQDAQSTGESAQPAGQDAQSTNGAEAPKRRRRAVRRAASPTGAAEPVVLADDAPTRAPLTTFGPVSSSPTTVAVRRRPRRRTAGRPAGPPVED